MSDITYFAQVDYRQNKKEFGIKLSDRRLHTHILGKTGVGKTTLIKNLIMQDIEHGHGVAVLDPHGDLAESLLDVCPSNRTQEIIYFNPTDQNYPIGFNILESVEPAQRPLVASQIISVFKNIWNDSWGPRLEYILYNSVYSLLAVDGQTLLGIPRILTDEKFRSTIIKKLDDPLIKNFWLNEFEQYSPAFKQEVIAPVLNKVGQFLIDPQIRNIVGQTKNKIDMGFVMDNNRILICNLAKGKIGEDKTNLLGSLIVTKLFLAALKRAEQPEEERKDFYLYIDECQNLASDIFTSILSEARKYRLNLILTHQYLDQLTINVKKAVLGNVGTIISFRLGASDARELELEFQPEFNTTDLENIGKHQIYLKMAIDGIASRPFSAVTLPPRESLRTGNRTNIIKTSREKYGTQRKVVEDKINRWLAYR